MRPTSPSATAGSAANVQTGLLLEHVEHRLQRHDRRGRGARRALRRPSRSPGRARRRARGPCPRRGTSRAPPRGRRRGSARCAGCGAGRGRCGRCRAAAATLRAARGSTSGSPVVRALRLAGELALGLDVVAALRGEHDLVALRLQHVGEQRLADAAVAVDRRGVDEVDAGVERGVEQSLLVVDDCPTSRWRGSRCRSPTSETSRSL